MGMEHRSTNNDAAEERETPKRCLKYNVVLIFVPCNSLYRCRNLVMYINGTEDYTVSKFGVP